MTQTKTMRTVIGIAVVLLLLGVVMAGAGAADDSPAGIDEEWKTVTTVDELKNAVASGGNVRLGATISMGGQLDIKNNVVLDLNGCELRFRGKWHIYVAPEGDLTINDSSNPSTGKIMGGYSSGSGGCIFVGGGGKLTLNNGTIRDGIAKNHGGGVYIDGGRFEMNGGKISDNISGDNGGGVYVNDGSTFTMEGGEIYDNLGDNGGGVFVKNSEFIMNGGTFSENDAENYGAGVCVDTGARFTMNGGSISDNSCIRDDGAGVCVLKGGKFIMTDGTIGKNTAIGRELYESYGGGVYVQGGEFEMSGGIIQENMVENDGGGVFVCENGTMSVSGDATITGNMKKDGKEVANVGLDSGGMLTLDGALSGEVRICSPKPKEGVEFGTATSKASGAENILSDDGTLCGKIDGGKLVWTTVNEGDSSSLSGALTADITTTTAAKSPVPVLGILAGLGVAALFLRRR